MTEVSTKLPDKVANQLAAIAKRTNKSIDYHILQALIEYLSEQSAVEVAHKRRMDKSIERVPIKEVKKRLGL
jgi:predicted transcriptional regulator